MPRALVTCAFLALLFVSGCHRAHPAGQSASNYKVYRLRGKIISTNPGTGNIIISHDAIPGFMDAMTMPYRVKNANIVADLHPGDVITADLMVSQTDEADDFLDHIVVVGQAKPDYKPTLEYHVPTAGDQVPDFKLRNQDGRAIALNQFRGKELLITFIYTRCPLPNFCPRVTHEFADINRQLQSDPALNRKTHLLCVSFDPANDTPERLRAYGASYIGSGAKSAFEHWDFAVPDKDTLARMAKFFDVGITPEPDSTITHTLSTTLIGADGKVVEFYPGNDWTVDQVLADVKRASGA